jgi:glycine cleavage system H protein
MTIPGDLLYTNEHEWVSIEDGLATVGITDYAQNELGDIVFVELPEVGTEVEAMETFGTIEAVKTVADLFSPANGTVEEINTALEDNPELVNTDPYGEGWMIKIKVSEEPEGLLTAKEYKEMIT